MPRPERLVRLLHGPLPGAARPRPRDRLNRLNRFVRPVPLRLRPPLSLWLQLRPQRRCRPRPRVLPKPWQRRLLLLLRRAGGAFWAARRPSRAPR